MTYAAGRASFASDVPDGAWWLYARDDGSTNACSTNAAAVILGVRAALGLAPIAAWDSSVLAALQTRAADLAGELPAWAPVRDELARDRTRVTRLAVLFAIYLTFYAPHGMRFDAIALPEAAEMPTLGALVGGAPQPVVCWNPARDPDPSRADADRDAAARETRYGVRVRPGEPEPARGPVSESPFAGPSDTAAWIGIGIALAIAFVLYRDTSPRAR